MTPSCIEPHIRFLICFCVAATMIGCGGGPRGGPRAETYPITGRILVDGAPASNLRITCHPLSKSDVVTTIAGFSDANGNFSISTYEKGDGAPEGEYAMTFMWGQISIMSGRYEGPDKLNGAYDDPENTEHVATVVAGLPTELGEINLTTQGGTDKNK